MASAVYVIYATHLGSYEAPLPKHHITCPLGHLDTLELPGLFAYCEASLCIVSR